MNYTVHSSPNSSLEIDVQNIKLIRDKNTGNFLGYGFLEFQTQEIANHALTTLRGQPMPDTANKKVFKLNWATYSSKTSQNSTNQNEFSIYVCELDSNVTEDVLKNYFSQFYNSVIGTKIIVDPSTKISKGYGFVKFSDYSESQRAISEMNGKLLNGKPMKTNQASFKKNNPKNTHPNNNSNYTNNMADPNLLMQQQQYYNNYYMNYPNYMNPMYYQMYYQQQGQGEMNLPNNENQ